MANAAKAATAAHNFSFNRREPLAEPKPACEPWRENVREVTATMLECRLVLRGLGIEPTLADLVELTRLCLAKEWGWPRRERAAPSD